MNFSITIPMQQNPVGVLMLIEYARDTGDLWKRLAPYFGEYDYTMFQYETGFTDLQLNWLFHNMTRRTLKKLVRSLMNEPCNAFKTNSLRVI
jgi:hypothetical protein